MASYFKLSDVNSGSLHLWLIKTSTWRWRYERQKDEGEEINSFSFIQTVVDFKLTSMVLVIYYLRTVFFQYTSHKVNSIYLKINGNFVHEFRCYNFHWSLHIIYCSGTAKNVGVQASEITSGGKYCTLLIWLVAHMELVSLMKYTEMKWCNRFSAKCVI
jgi:hypothetical protein